MTAEPLDTHQKAFQLNLDRDKYGTLAEIGAGQEVARWFFRVGGAAGTVAKSMSAYDMTVSDSIYGSGDRYVSRERLTTMLDFEFRVLRERLAGERGATTQFFAFANTVTARSYARREAETHGWMGLRFQHAPGAEPSDVVLHVRMLDSENLQQQEALGILGVNLVYGGFHYHDDPPRLVSSLLDGGLSMERIEVNLIRCTGPAFAPTDPRLLTLELVSRHLTEAAMFRANGEVVDASELLYRKPLLVLRGSFRPATRTTVAMIESARARFLDDPEVGEEDLVVMAEMTLLSLGVDEAPTHEDFLDRVDTLAALGIDVLITDTLRYFRLASYLFQHTKRKIAIAMGLPTLRELFQPGFYGDLEGGILEAFGRLFKNDLRIYVYPIRDDRTGELVTAETMEVPFAVRHLHGYLVDNHLIEGLAVDALAPPDVFPSEVLRMIRRGEKGWEDLVPPAVAAIIKDRGLFGHPARRGGDAPRGSTS